MHIYMCVHIHIFMWSEATGHRHSHLPPQYYTQFTLASKYPELCQVWGALWLQCGALWLQWGALWLKWGALWLKWDALWLQVARCSCSWAR